MGRSEALSEAPVRRCRRGERSRGQEERSQDRSSTARGWQGLHRILGEQVVYLG